MSRILIAVGCDVYDNIRGLSGAVSDARLVTRLLTGPNRYQYRADLSVLLESPTAHDLRQAIADAYERRPSEILFYFAGHAESREGRLFLKFKDTKDGALLPPTSITLGEILDTLSQVPGLNQLNIIVDACNASGLRTDLARALAERASKVAGLLSIAILAGAGPELAARETASGGRLTRAIGEILDGTVALQRWSPYFDLAQVAEGVIRVHAVAEQAPSYWGINLGGANPIAPNLRFDPSTAANANPESFFTGAVRLSEAQLEGVRAFLDGIRTFGWDSSLLRPLQVLLEPLPVNQQVSVYLALASSVETYERSADQLPPQREAMLLQALLPLSGDPSARLVCESQATVLVRRATERLISLRQKLREQHHTLVMSGFSEIYFLPLRVSHVLGWIGVALIASDRLSELSQLRELTSSILLEYGEGLVALDDRQASGIFTFCIGALKHGWRDECEEVVSRLFVDLHKSRGRVSRSANSARQKIEYLVHRYSPVALKKIVQRPSELLAVVLIVGAISGMDAVWNDMLFDLDHAAMNMFLTEHPLNFADEKIQAGENRTMEIGYQFYSLLALRHVISDIEESPAMSDWLGTIVLDAISVAIPDRVNWFRLVNLLGKGEITMHKNTLRLSSQDPESGALTVIYDSNTNR